MAQVIHTNKCDLSHQLHDGQIHVIISLSTENTFDKIPHLFPIKAKQIW
jgi:hypothetical protein